MSSIMFFLNRTYVTEWVLIEDLLNPRIISELFVNNNHLFFYCGIPTTCVLPDIVLYV